MRKEWIKRKKNLRGLKLMYNAKNYHTELIFAHCRKEWDRQAREGE
jgi:hypothetical protein